LTASITLHPDPAARYVLRVADSVLIHVQRLGEWAGHAPILEEDIALTNLGLDLLGQARALLTWVAQRLGGGLDEDQLAYLRDEGNFLNATLVELPLRRGGGDFADTQLRNLFVAAWLQALWQPLQRSADAELAGIAAKATKECAYHLAHAGDWVVRLGDGTPESAQRLQAALQRAWPYVAELFDDDAVDEAAAASGLGPRSSTLQAAWLAVVQPALARAGLALPATGAFRSSGRRGLHSEHLGPLLAEMQVLQRSFPGGVW
jgi:ring-1,2-phenylacetyl-CoA epoxidase subunit PaaC